MGDESTHISLERDGRIAVTTQPHPGGQGHETTLAQVASDELQVRFEDVVVRYGDTHVTPPALVATGGTISVRGTPAVGLSRGELARIERKSPIACRSESIATSRPPAPTRGRG